MKNSNCGPVLCPIVFREKLKRDMNRRIDLFFDQLKTKKARSKLEWVIEFMSWSAKESM